MGVGDPPGVGDAVELPVGDGCVVADGVGDARIAVKKAACGIEQVLGAPCVSAKVKTIWISTIWLSADGLSMILKTASPSLVVVALIV